MTQGKLEEITSFLVTNIFRNSDIMFNDVIRGNHRGIADGPEEEDLCYIIASLHNMLYKEVTGEYYDYMFHWANKVGAWIYDDLFKPEDEKHERY